MRAWEAVVAAGEGPAATALTRLGNAHRRLGDIASAEATLARGLARFPEHAGLATELAQVAVTARDWPLAVERWRRVARLQGDLVDARTFSRLARAELRAGDAEASSATLARGLGQYPDDVDLATEYAHLATVARDWTEAARRWQSVLDASGDGATADTFEQLAKAYQHLGDMTRADDVLERGVALHPDDLTLVERHARLANVDRDWPEVVRRWQTLLDLGGDQAPPRAYIQLARAHQAQGNLEAADEVLELGRDRHPEDVEVAARWARLATATRAWDRAVERYRVATALPTGAPADVHRDRARAAAELEDWPAAEAALQLGLSQHPDHPTLLVERAFLAIDRGDWDEADAAWSAATDATDVPPDLYVGMARRCAAAFDHRRADAVIEAGLAHHADDRGLQRQLVRNAISLQRREHAPDDWDWTDALTRAERILALYRETESEPGDHLRLATELADTTALSEAVTVLRAGLEVHPDANEIRHELAMLAAALGDWDEAAVQLQRLVTDPDAPVATRSALVRSHIGRGDHAGATAAIGDLAAAGKDEPRLRGELARIATARGDHAAAADGWRAVRDLVPRSVDVHRRLVVALRRAGDHEAAAATVADARAAGIGLESNPGVVAIIGGGPSLRGVDLTPLRGVVHTVAVNATATVLPWSDVAVTHDPSHLAERFRGYPGPVVAGLPLAALHNRGSLPGFTFRRRLVTDRLSDLDEVVHSGGHTSAHTALNYAYLLGPTRIVLFGIDLTEFWGPNDYWHGAMDSFNRQRFADLEARATFDRWSEYRLRKLENAPAVFASTVPQLEAAGTAVFNASPVSSLTCFPKVTPEEGIERCLEGVLAS